MTVSRNLDLSANLTTQLGLCQEIVLILLNMFKYYDKESLGEDDNKATKKSLFCESEVLWFIYRVTNSITFGSRLSYWAYVVLSGIIG